MVAGAERASHRRTIGNGARLDENGSEYDERCLEGERADENETTTGRCWIGSRPAGETVKGAEKEGAKAECGNRRDGFQIGVCMSIEPSAANMVLPGTWNEG